MKIKNVLNVLIIGMTILMSSFSYGNFDFRFQTLSKKDGISSNYIISVYQDQKGYMWFSTTNGLDRYDGENFLNYNRKRNQKNSISSNYVYSIKEDNDNNIWVATENGIDKIKNGIVSHYEVKTDKSIAMNDWAISIVHSKNDEIFVGTNKGLFKYNKDKDLFDKIPSPKIKNEVGENYFSTSQMTFTDNGDLLIAAYEGLLTYNRDINEVTYLENKNNKTHITEKLSAIYYSSVTQSVYIGSEEGKIYEYNNNNISEIKIKTKGFKKEYITSFISFANDYLVIGTWDKGIFTLNLKTGAEYSFSIKTHPDKMNSNQINYLFKDNNNTVWIGTSEGLLKYSSYHRYSKMLLNTDIFHNKNIYINSILKYDNNNTYLATEHGLFNKKNEDYEHVNIEFSNDTDEYFRFNDSSIDKNKNLWFSTSKGLTFYNPKEKNHINFFNKEEIDNSMKDNLDFPIGEILKIETSSNGNLWFSSYDSNGLYLMDVDKKEIISKYLYKESEPYNKNKDYISDILDRGDTIWVATSSNIIKLDRKTGETKYINITKSKENVRISFLKEMSDGKIWIGTDGYGLLIGDIDSNNELTFDVINHKELNSSSLINVIEYDKFIWITSDKEIYRYQISSGEVIKYSNMLIDIENTFIQHSIEMDGDNLLIATKKGLFEMNTEKSFLNIYKPNISLTEILNGKKEIIPNSDGKENKFNYKDNNFKFYFSALDFTNPNSNKYKYKLDGFEKNWIYLKSEVNMVTYNNLDAGNYTFMVKGTNSSGVWSDNTAFFKFEIQSPWWKYAISFLIFLSCVLIFFLIISRQKQISNLRIQATRDSLTKISNRNGFNEYKKESFKRANKNSYAICLLDMDYFKDVNDTMGHDIGDEYLVKIANIIKKTIGEDNHVSRLGGDEFAIIINNFKMISDLEKLINDIHNNINEVHYINEKIIDGSASIGVSIFTGEETSKSLLKNADIAMYNSKRRGKNKISYFNKNMAQDFFRKNKIKKHLKSGLKFNEFKLNYQPIINKNNGKVESLEALLRWDNKVLGRVSPIDFIPEAEHNGTIVAIGDWVLEEACSQASEWNKLGLLDKYISVNVSPVQMAKGDIESTIVNILDKTGLPPNKLQIEITESIFISNINNTLQIIDNLRAIGVRFALDDFGTGYSSLCYLSKLKLDAIKLDKEFIDDVCTNEMTQKMVKQIVHLSKMMDADLIIEGIETEEQIKALSDFKYQNAQGYYYSKPLVTEDATIVLGK